MKPFFIFGLQHWRSLSAMILAGAAAAFIAFFPPALPFITSIAVFKYMPFALLTTATASAMGAGLVLFVSGIFNLVLFSITKIVDGIREKYKMPGHRAWNMLDILGNSLLVGLFVFAALGLLLVPLVLGLGHAEILLFPLAIAGAVALTYIVFMAMVDIAIRIDNICRQTIMNLEQTKEMPFPKPAVSPVHTSEFTKEAEGGLVTRKNSYELVEPSLPTPKPSSFTSLCCFFYIKCPTLFSKEGTSPSPRH